MSDSQWKGFVSAGGAFLLWGLVPIYWKALAHVSAFELILHRVVWSVVLLLFLLWGRGRLREFAAAFMSSGSVATHALAGLLLSVNWLVFIWAVNAGRVIDTSLGYYLVPFISTGLGCFILRERLNRIQVVAMSLAFGGVVLQIVHFGAVPWVGLALAVSFGFYGLMRKRSPLGSLTGVGVETVLMAPVAVVILFYLEASQGGALGGADLPTVLLLMGTGLVTAVPLLLFSTGARLIPLSSIGLMQFITPSCTLLLGLLVYKEPFPPGRFVSFLLIWAGLTIYLLDAGRGPPKPAARSRPPA